MYGLQLDEHVADRVADASQRADDPLASAVPLSSNATFSVTSGWTCI
jgi:hypothetical protein